MTKKGTKKVTQDVTTENENNIINKDTVVENTPINKDTVAESIPINKDSLETLSIVELVALEQACNKVCNRYEVGARLYLSTGDVTDKGNNELFYTFKNYYDLIFDELKKRVIKYCKK